MPTFLTMAKILSCFMAGLLPYMLLLVYPFRNHLRLKGFPAGFLSLLLAAAQLHLELQLSLGTSALSLPLPLLQSGAFLLFSLLAIRAPIHKVLMNTASVMSFSLLIHAAAQSAGRYSLRYLLITLALQAVILVPYALVLVKCLAPTLNISGAKVWSFLWIIPTLVAAAGCILFYLNVASATLATILVIAVILSATAVTLVLYLTKTEMITLLFTKMKPVKQAPPTPAPAAQVPDWRQQHYVQLQTRMEESERSCRDMLAQVVAMGDHLDNREFEQLREKIAALKKQLAPVDCDTGNNRIDPVLSYFIRQAQLANIKVATNVVFPDKSSFADADLMILVGALMDIATEGCRSQTSGTRRIALATYLEDGELQLGIKFTHDETPEEDNEFLQICRQVVQYHGGTVEVSGIEGVSQIVAMMKI